MTVRASIENRVMYLSDETSIEIATRWFGAEAIAALPKYSKGKYKGKLKAVVTYRKCVKGGWVSEGAEGYGHVERRVDKVISAELRVPVWGKQYEEVVPVASYVRPNQA
jgi:hypothetical protein